MRAQRKDDRRQVQVSYSPKIKSIAQRCHQLIARHFQVMVCGITFAPSLGIRGVTSDAFKARLKPPTHVTQMPFQLQDEPTFANTRDWLQGANTHHQMRHVLFRFILNTPKQFGGLLSTESHTRHQAPWSFFAIHRLLRRSHRILGGS